MEFAMFAVTWRWSGCPDIVHSVTFGYWGDATDFAASLGDCALGIDIDENLGISNENTN
jgi:hypothetical protein